MSIFMFIVSYFCNQPPLNIFFLAQKMELLMSPMLPKIKGKRGEKPKSFRTEKLG